MAIRKIYICINKKGGQACIGSQSREVFRALREGAKALGDTVEIERKECMGYCSEGPNVKIHGGRSFHEVGVDDVTLILDAALSKTTPP